MTTNGSVESTRWKLNILDRDSTNPRRTSKVAERERADGGKVKGRVT